jgi:hypothetical protein
MAHTESLSLQILCLQDGFSKSPSRDLISDSSLVDERTRSSSFKAKESSSGAPENHKYSPDKPFKPPHILRSGAAYATFSPFPPHVDDPFDDRKVRMAVNSDRLLPMQIQTERYVGHVCIYILIFFSNNTLTLPSEHQTSVLAGHTPRMDTYQPRKGDVHQVDRCHNPESKSLNMQVI